MTRQVDDIVSILGSVRRRHSSEGNADDRGGDVLSCLVSATLPERARGVCDKWVLRSRVVVLVCIITKAGFLSVWVRRYFLMRLIHRTLELNKMFHDHTIRTGAADYLTG
jgi:hypothetical protein